METNDLQEFLGMAVHFVYYHHSKLHNENVFEDDYCEHLMKIGDIKYWEKMYRCLEFALTQKDDCLHLIDSPFLEIYSESDTRLFFEKFYPFLGRCLKHSS